MEYLKAGIASFLREQLYKISETSFSAAGKLGQDVPSDAERDLPIKVQIQLAQERRNRMAKGLEAQQDLINKVERIGKIMNKLGF